MREGKRRVFLAALCVVSCLFALFLGGCGGKREKKEIEGVLFESVTLTYDGEAHAPTAERLPSGVTVVYTPNARFTDVGVYSVTATFGGEGFVEKTMTATLTIEPAANAWSEPLRCDGFDYDGETALLPTARAAFGTVAYSYSVDGETWSDTAPSRAGVWHVRAAVAQTDNYGGLTQTVQATIAKRKIEKPAVEASFVYDGAAKTALVSNADYTVTGNTATAAGDYTAAVSLADAQNTCWADGSADDLSLGWTIAKRKIEKPAVEASFVYDGAAKTALVSDADYMVTGNTATAAGDYTAAVSLADAQNTCWADGSADDLSLGWMIAKADAVITMPDLTVKYDGEAHSVTARLNHGESELVYDGNGKREQGVYTVTVSAAESANYRAARATATLTITRATHTVTFRQAGFDDVLRHVLDLADLDDIPEPQAVAGYAIRWGGDADFIAVTEDFVVEAVAEAIEYEIEYETDGGVNAENATSYTVEQAVTLTAPTKYGNSFLGWFADAERTQPADGIAPGSTGARKFWAKWQPQAAENAVIYQGELSAVADGDDETFVWLDRSAGDDTAVILDFGSVITVRDVRVLTGKPDGNDSWKGEVWLSANGTDFVSAGAVTGSEEQLFYLADRPTEARYLKLTLDAEWVTSTNWLAVRGLAVNTQSVYVTYGNIDLEVGVPTPVTAMTDGDLQTYRWFGAPRAEADGQTWFMLDLCEPRTVRNVRFLMAKKDSIDDFLKAVRLEYSVDGVDFVTVENFDGVRNVYYEFETPISARYLRVVNTAATANGCVVREFSVNVEHAVRYGDGFKPYDYVRSGHEITDVSYACDGDEATFLDLEAVDGGARTITLDLGGARTVSLVSVLSGGTFDGVTQWGDSIESCVLEYSEDGTEYTELGAYASDDGVYEIAPDAPFTARYLRLTVVNAGWITLREFSAQSV